MVWRRRTPAPGLVVAGAAVLTLASTRPSTSSVSSPSSPSSSTPPTPWVEDEREKPVRETKQRGGGDAGFFCLANCKLLYT